MNIEIGYQFVQGRDDIGGIQQQKPNRSQAFRVEPSAHQHAEVRKAGFSALALNNFPATVKESNASGSRKIFSFSIPQLFSNRSASTPNSPQEFRNRAERCGTEKSHLRRD